MSKVELDLEDAKAIYEEYEKAFNKAYPDKNYPLSLVRRSHNIVKLFHAISKAGSENPKKAIPNKISTDGLYVVISYKYLEGENYAYSTLPSPFKFWAKDEYEAKTFLSGYLSGKNWSSVNFDTGYTYKLNDHKFEKNKATKEEYNGYLIKAFEDVDKHIEKFKDTIRKFLSDPLNDTDTE